MFRRLASARPALAGRPALPALTVSHSTIGVAPRSYSERAGARPGLGTRAVQSISSGYPAASASVRDPRAGEPATTATAADAAAAAETPAAKAKTAKAKAETPAAKAKTAKAKAKTAKGKGSRPTAGVIPKTYPELGPGWDAIGQRVGQSVSTAALPQVLTARHSYHANNVDAPNDRARDKINRAYVPHSDEMLPVQARNNIHAGIHRSLPNPSSRDSAIIDEPFEAVNQQLVLPTWMVGFNNGKEFSAHPPAESSIWSPDGRSVGSQQLYDRARSTVALGVAQAQAADPNATPGGVVVPAGAAAGQFTLNKKCASPTAKDHQTVEGLSQSHARKANLLRDLKKRQLGKLGIPVKGGYQPHDAPYEESRAWDEPLSPGRLAPGETPEEHERAIDDLERESNRSEAWEAPLLPGRPEARATPKEQHEQALGQRGSEASQSATKPAKKQRAAEAALTQERALSR